MHYAKFAANYVFQFCAVDKLHDRQSADGNNETRLQNPNLIIHPQRTVTNLIRCWDAVGAAGVFAGETTADRGEIDLRSNGGFVHSAKLFEPTEERFAGGVRKRSFQCRFPWTGRLPDDHHIAHDRATGYRRGLHAWTAAAAKKRPYMFVESILGSCCSHGPMGRSHIAGEHARSDGPQARGYSVRSPKL
jgi:hypothetical protein